MNTIPVGHEARGERDDAGTLGFTDQCQIEADIVLRVRVIAARVQIRRDVPDTVGERRVQIDELDIQSTGERCAHRRLAGAAGANESDHSWFWSMWWANAPMSSTRTRRTDRSNEPNRSIRGH